MKVKLGQQVRVQLDVDGGEVVAVFPPRTNAEMIREVRKLKFAAMPSGRSQNMQKIAARIDEARVGFFDRCCVGVENVTFENEQGDDEDLAPDVEGWKDRIPEDWKAAFARYFDDREALSAAELGN